jgi:hypothetical protein
LEVHEADAPVLDNCCPATVGTARRVDRGSRIKARLRPILITSGHSVTQEGGSFHVPKKELASVLQVLLQSRRIKVASALAEAATLVREPENFKVKITLAANETYEAWREGMHDDLVLAVAVAAWLGENLIGMFREEDLAASRSGRIPAFVPRVRSCRERC